MTVRLLPPLRGHALMDAAGLHCKHGGVSSQYKVRASVARLPAISNGLAGPMGKSTASGPPSGGSSSGGSVMRPSVSGAGGIRSLFVLPDLNIHVPVGSGTISS